MSTENIPTTRKELEKRAREELNKKCKDYVAQGGNGRKPVELTKKNWENIKAWIKDKNKEPKTLGASEEVSKWLEGESFKERLPMKDVNDKLLIDWATESQVKKDKQDKLNSPASTFVGVLDNFITNLRASTEKFQKFRENNFPGPIKDTELLTVWKDWIAKPDKIDAVKREMENIQNKKIKGHWSVVQDSWETMKKEVDTFAAAIDDIVAMKTKGNGDYTFHNPGECKENLFHKRKFFGQEVEHRTVNQVRVMHWNILADGLSGATLSLTGYAKSLTKQFKSPKECLIWDYRKWLILEEIAHYDPDIITLVELDDDQGENRVNLPKKPEDRKKLKGELDRLFTYLKPLDYEMKYVARKMGVTEMGHGIFWKNNKFTAEDDEMLWQKLNTDKQFFTLMRFLQKNEPKRKLAVCSLHLASDKDPKGEETRFKQIWEALYFLNYKVYNADLQKLYKDMGFKEEDFKIPMERDEGTAKVPDDLFEKYSVIITGDFNAEPKLSLSDKSELVVPHVASAPNAAGFKSFYDEIIGDDLPWTSWKGRPKGRTDQYTLDYVFGSDKTKALGVLGGVEDKHIDTDILLPNYESASDHISLVVDVELLEKPLKWEKKTNTDTNTGRSYLNSFWFGVLVSLAVVGLTGLLWRYLGPGSRRRHKSASASVN